MAGAKFDVALAEWKTTEPREVSGPGTPQPDMQWPVAPWPSGADQPGSTRGTPGPPARLRWRSLGDGLLASFLIAGPSLLAGFILRDQHVRAWVVLLAIAGAGFLVGGAIAGRHRRAARGAFWQGMVCGLLPATAVVLADVIRTTVLGHGISAHALALWLGVEAASMFVAALAALIGRRMFIRTRSRKLSLTS